MDTFERVKKLLVDDMHCLPEEVTMEASFIDDLGMDSLDTMQVVMHLEQVFDIYIDDDVAEKINTVGDAVKHVDSQPVAAE